MYYVLYIFYDRSVLLYVVKRTILFVEHYRVYESYIPLRTHKTTLYMNHTYHELWRPYSIDEPNITDTMFLSSS